MDDAERIRLLHEDVGPLVTDIVDVVPPAEVMLVAYFNFIGGQLFVSDDYEPNEDGSWHASGYWSHHATAATTVNGVTTPVPPGRSSVKELLIYSTALKYVEFKARS